MAKEKIEETEIKSGDLDNQDGWKELTGNIFTFKNEEDFLIGELLAIEEGKAHGNKVYKVNDGDQTHTVFSTTVMQSLMAEAKVGDTVKIVYKGETPATDKGKNPTKQFKVWIKEK